MNAMSALYHIAQIDPPKLATPADWSDGFQRLVSTCLQKEPEERPTAQELLQVHIHIHMCMYMYMYVVVHVHVKET